MHKNRPDDFIHMDKPFIYLFTVWAVTIWIPTIAGKRSYSPFIPVFILSIKKHGVGKVNLLVISVVLTDTIFSEFLFINIC